jgi:hypothetical protein
MPQTTKSQTSFQRFTPLSPLVSEMQLKSVGPGGAGEVMRRAIPRVPPQRSGEPPAGVLVGILLGHHLA